MTYVKQEWHDEPATDTPITAASLTHMEEGIAEALTSTEARARFAFHQPRLAKFYAALGDVESAIISIVMLGDSFLEGTGATSLRTRLVSVLQTLLRRRSQPLGIVGAEQSYIAAYSDAPIAYPIAKTGTTGSAKVGGLGLRTLTLSAGATATITFTGTSAKLAWTAGPGGGRFTVSVDGGAESAIIDGYSATVVSGNLYAINGLNAGQHTVRITHDSSSPANRQIYIEGLVTFNGDESRGIRVIDASRHGVQTSEFLASDSWLSSFRALGPHALVTVALGHNEATSKVTAAVYKANIQDLIGRIRSNARGNHSGAIQLLFWPKRAVVTDAALWESYFVALKEIEAADPDILVTDLRNRIADMPTPYNAAAGLGFWDNGGHMTDRGQGASAQFMAAAITPR